MPNVTGRGLLGCFGIAVAVLLVALAVIPFTRNLALGLVSGEPIGEDWRPLSYHVRRLSDPDPEVVYNAMIRIQSFDERGAPAIPALLDVARDPDRGSHTAGKFGMQVRTTALSTIGRMGPSAAGAVPELIPFLAHPQTDTRIAVLQALHRIGPAAVADPRPIAPAMLDSDTQVGNEASRLLAEYATDFYKDEIRRQLVSDSPRARALACDWAGGFGPAGREFLPILQKVMSDPDPSVRLEAAGAIASIELRPAPARREP